MSAMWKREAPVRRPLFLYRAAAMNKGVVYVPIHDRPLQAALA